MVRSLFGIRGKTGSEDAPAQAAALDTSFALATEPQLQSNAVFPEEPLGAHAGSTQKLALPLSEL